MLLLLPDFLALEAILIFISAQNMCQQLERFSFDSSTDIFYAMYETAGSLRLVGLFSISELLTLAQRSSSLGFNTSILVCFENCVTYPHIKPPRHVLQYCSYSPVLCCSLLPLNFLCSRVRWRDLSLVLLAGFSHGAGQACINGTGVTQQTVRGQWPLWLCQKRKQKTVLSTGKIQCPDCL